MSVLLKKAWDDYLCPMLRRPKRLQVAALCYRSTDSGKDVLLITSRDTRRWIIPKGWPIKGLNARQAAVQEAWEEAGVKNEQGAGESIGSYFYQKRMSTGWSVPVEALVFPVKVQHLKDDFPEASERDRKWVSAAEAANLVNEPELQDILRGL
jgi:8-oxo-dGTP pyrophosphatase MutT (NUDIX family)